MRNSRLNRLFTVSVTVSTMAVLFVLAALVMLRDSRSPLFHFSFPTDSTPVILSEQGYSYSENESPDEAPALRSWTFICPELVSPHQYLSVYFAHQYASIYMEDQLVFACREASPPSLIKTPGYYWALLPLRKTDEGKTIRIDIQDVYASMPRMNPRAQISNEYMLLFVTLGKQWPRLAAGLLCVALALFYVTSPLLIQITQKERWSMICLGLFTAVFGIYRTSHQPLTALLLSEQTVPGVSALLAQLSLIGFLFTPLLLTRFLAWEHDRKPFYQWMSAALAIFLAAMLLLQLLKICDLRESQLPCSILYTIVISVLLVKSSQDLLRNPPSSSWHWGHVLYLLMGVASLVDNIVYFVNGIPLTDFTLYVVLAHSILRGTHNNLRTFKQRERLRQMEAELSNQRMYMLMSQIRPHFIYNTMNSIYSLCDQDTEKAKQAIHDFSRFLRLNFESLDQLEPVPFSRELELVRFYLSIEKIRFQDSLTVSYHINTEQFWLPPLTLQPLVENAVRHGLRRKAGPGTIDICTREIKDAYLIIIRDDGAGFDPAATLGQGDEAHLGIANVQARLQQLCGGTLTLESQPGTGTTVTIRLPKEAQPDEHSDRG